MKLGKALATGVAEELPQSRDEEMELPDLRPDFQEAEEAAQAALEEAPVAR
ncbi:hypothetical protein GCM10023086_67120 [Streptomyces venetus]|uniref:Uncharacterized protein n=1 Tax=Streptomyces venetus TaxID=1701086 RepID=A0ABP8H674_9ACTN